MRTLLLIAVLAFAAFADTELTFKGGVNLTNADSDFSFRFTHAEVDPLLTTKALLWSSASVDANTAGTEAKASADGMIGFGILPTLLISPTVLFAYGNGSASIGIKLDTLASNIFVSHGGFGAAFQGGAMAMSALTMQELDKDNKAVGDLIYMRPLLGTDCDGKKIEGDSGSLTGLTCTYNPIKKTGNLVVPLAKTDAEVTITYVTSTKAGILEYGKTPVSPRSYEMIVEVKKFPLSDDKNHVRMSFGFLTVSVGAKLNGTTTEVISREGMDDAYIAASEYVVVNGNRAKAAVSVASGNPDVDSSLEVILEAALGAKFDARIASVDFPAGAKEFIYDPAVGAGKNVYAASASTAAISLFLVLVCVLLFLF